MDELQLLLQKDQNLMGQGESEEGIKLLCVCELCDKLLVLRS